MRKTSKNYGETVTVGLFSCENVSSFIILSNLKYMRRYRRASGGDRYWNS